MTETAGSPGQDRVTDSAASGLLVHSCGITLVGAWSERDQAIVFPPCPKCEREAVKCQAEQRQVDKINDALAVCDQVERNPVGWGGDEAVSLARTIRRALTGKPVNDADK